MSEEKKAYTKTAPVYAVKKLRPIIGEWLKMDFTFNEKFKIQILN